MQLDGVFLSKLILICNLRYNINFTQGNNMNLENRHNEIIIDNRRNDRNEISLSPARLLSRFGITPLPSPFDAEAFRRQQQREAGRAIMQGSDYAPEAETQNPSLGL